MLQDDRVAWKELCPQLSSVVIHCSVAFRLAFIARPPRKRNTGDSWRRFRGQLRWNSLKWSDRRHQKFYKDFISIVFANSVRCGNERSNFFQRSKTVHKSSEVLWTAVRKHCSDFRHLPFLHMSAWFVFDYVWRCNNYKVVEHNFHDLSSLRHYRPYPTPCLPSYFWGFHDRQICLHKPLNAWPQSRLPTVHVKFMDETERVDALYLQLCGL